MRRLVGLVLVAAALGLASLSAADTPVPAGSPPACAESGAKTGEAGATQLAQSGCRSNCSSRRGYCLSSCRSGDRQCRAICNDLYQSCISSCR